MIWLNRTIFTVPFHYGLCTSEAIFKKALRGMKVAAKDAPPFISNEHSHGTTHFFENDGRTSVLVCIRVESRSGIEVAGLLVHEAVHIWQEIRTNIGESAPSSEFEAYAIQHLSQHLMDEFNSQVNQSQQEGE